VRAAAESAIPIISAVGHETDWTLIDLAADARAPTPTKAAEWAVPKQSELIARMAELRERRHLAMARGMEARLTALRSAARGLGRPQKLVESPRQRLDGVTTRLRQSLRTFSGEKRALLLRWQGRLDVRLITQRAERCHERVRALDREMRQVVRGLVQQRHRLLERHAGRLRPSILHHPASRGRERLDTVHSRVRKTFAACLDVKHRRVDALSQLLRSLSHRSVLDRGFALVRDRDGHPLRRLAEAEAAGQVELEFADGRAGAVLEDAPSQPAPPSSGRKSAAAQRPAQAQHKVNDPQGQLF
jgi:exodeoxyribonuclease VII large subunit